MEMQIKIFNVPSTGGEQENEELNLFLRSHKILNVRDEFTPSLGWCFRVEYIDGAFPSPAPSKGSNEKEQYSKLSLEQKDIYSRLKIFMLMSQVLFKHVTLPHGRKRSLALLGSNHARGTAAMHTHGRGVAFHGVALSQCGASHALKNPMMNRLRLSYPEKS